MQKVVFENDISTALKLLNNENAVSVNFGTINEYSDNDLDNYTSSFLNSSTPPVNCL